MVMDDKYMEMKNLSLPQPDGSVNNSLEDQAKAVFATQRLERMFGCYRKEDANDPEVYMAGAVGILVRFSREVITKVTDPVDGLPAQSVFLPSLAEISLACEKETARRERLRNFGEPISQISQRKTSRFAERPIDKSPNCFVADTAPDYEVMLRLHNESDKTRSFVERRTCYDGVVRTGVWVPLGWYQDRERGLPVSEKSPDPSPEVEDGELFFQCPGCGKDIAETDTAHKENCEWNSRGDI